MVQNVISRPIRLLVHLHVHYPDQLPYFFKQLSYLTACEWDFVVTLSAQHVSYGQDIKRFKPDARILVVENKGYDVWPFFQVLNTTDLSHYDYILKLHTKNTRENECRLFDVKWSGYFWRNLLVEPLLGSKKNVKRNLSLLQKNPKIGILTSQECIIARNNFYPEDTFLFDQLCEKLKLPNTCRLFVAGTMFFIRPEILKPLQDAHFSAADFNTISLHTGSTSSLAHTIERMFIPLAYYYNFEVKGLKYSVYQRKRFFYALTHHILAVTNEKKQKVLWLLWMKIPLSKKPLS